MTSGCVQDHKDALFYVIAIHFLYISHLLHAFCTDLFISYHTTTRISLQGHRVYLTVKVTPWNKYC